MMSVLLANSPLKSASGSLAASAISESVTSAQLLRAAQRERGGEDAALACGLVEHRRSPWPTHRGKEKQNQRRMSHVRAIAAARSSRKVSAWRDINIKSTAAPLLCIDRA